LERRTFRSKFKEEDRIVVNLQILKERRSHKTRKLFLDAKKFNSNYYLEISQTTEKQSLEQYHEELKD
jgi:hypothetical protein